MTATRLHFHSRIFEGPVKSGPPQVECGLCGAVFDAVDIQGWLTCPTCYGGVSEFPGDQDAYTVKDEEV